MGRAGGGPGREGGQDGEGLVGFVGLPGWEEKEFLIEKAFWGEERRERCGFELNLEGSIVENKCLGNAMLMWEEMVLLCLILLV